jgi:hypothetical protein
VAKLFSELPEPSFVAGNCNVRSNDGKLLYVNQPKKLKFTDLLLGPGINPYPINPSAYFYHISLHQRIGLYDTNEHYALDLDFLLRAVQVANLFYINETWGNYWQVEGSKSILDSRTEEGRLRVRRMMKFYMDTLEIPQRWLIMIANKLSNTCCVPLVYFSTKPDELSWRFKARVGKMVRNINLPNYKSS